MATVVNFIDTTLQAAPSRTVNLPNAQILLTPSAPAFHVTAGGSNSPASITFSSTLIALEGAVSFACTGGTLTNVTATSADLTYANMSAAIAAVTASVTVNGATFSAPCTVSKVVDGTNGTNSPPQTASQLKATLAGQITESELYAALQSRIALVDGASSVAGSVNARVAAATASASSDLASAQSSLNSSISANGSAIVALQNTDATHTSAITSLGTRATTSESNITTLQGTSSSQATALTSLTTRTTTAESNITSLNTTTSGQATSLSALTTRVGTTESSITSLNSTTASQATAISTLNTTVGGNSSSISTQQTTLNGLSAQYTVKVDNNGYVAGFGLASTAINGTPTSSFIVNVDKFAIVAPGIAPKAMFAVGNVNGVSSIGINGAVTIDGSLTLRTAAGAVVADATGLKAGYEAPGTKNSDLAIGGDNLALNSSFERMTSGIADGYGIYGSVASGASVAGEVTTGIAGPGRTGGASQGVTWTTAHTGPKGISGSVIRYGAWIPNKQYVLSFYAYTSNLSSSSSFHLNWNTSPVSVVANPNNPAAITTGWQKWSFLITWGATVESAGNAYITLDTGAGGGTIYFDDLKVSEGNVDSAYSPSVAEAQSTADTANAALAYKLNSNAANILAGGAGLTAGTLTYDSSGNRTGGFGMAFNQRGIVGYNSSGTATITMNASTGDITIAGTITAASVIAGTLASTLVSQASGAAATTTAVNNVPTIAGVNPINYTMVYSAGASKPIVTITNSTSNGSGPYKYTYVLQYGDFNAINISLTRSSTGGNTDNVCAIRGLAFSDAAQSSGTITITSTDSLGRASSTVVSFTVYS